MSWKYRPKAEAEIYAIPYFNRECRMAQEFCSRHDLFIIYIHVRDKHIVIEDMYKNKITIKEGQYLVKEKVGLECSEVIWKVSAMDSEIFSERYEKD